LSSAATIVGRESELAQLDAFVADAEQQAAVFVLEGELGSGKTTLWTHAVEAASRRGFTVLVARPSGAETGFSDAGPADLLAPASGKARSARLFPRARLVRPER
jgi:hypothetical protein